MNANAKETIKYLYEHGHIIQYEHYKFIMQELTKPITEHPDVQRLITKHDILIRAAKSVVAKLRKRRIHPMDILPIENPQRLAKELVDAFENN